MFTSKNILKKVRILLLFATIITVSTFLVVRIWLGYRFDSVVKTLDYKAFSQNIKNSDKLPNKLYTAYSKVYNYSENTSTNILILKTPFKIVGFDVNPADCPCVEVNYGFVLSFWDRLTVGIQLDKDLGSKKCLDYYLNNFSFDYGIIGVKKASKFYFNKPLNQLSENEMIELCIMTLNPSLYNKKTHPEELKNEFLRITK